MKTVREINEAIEFIDAAIAKEKAQMAELVNDVVEEITLAAQKWIDSEVDRSVDKNLARIRTLQTEGIAALKAEIREFREVAGGRVRASLGRQEVWAHINSRASPCESAFRSLVATAVSGLLPILERNQVQNYDHWEAPDGGDWRPKLKALDVVDGEVTKKYAQLDRQVGMRRNALEERNRELLDAQARELWKSI
jgi:hypothetical protein